MKNRLRFVIIAAATCSVWAGVACSSSSTSTPDGSDAATTAETGAGADASAPPSSDAGPDAAPAVVNACTTFVDRSADSASRSIQWDLDVVSIPERCMKIKAGQTVAWVNGADAGDFDTHPLEVFLPAEGSGGPMILPTDATGKVTFPNASLYGFQCGVHPQMRGAILVVP